VKIKKNIGNISFISIPKQELCIFVVPYMKNIKTNHIKQRYKQLYPGDDIWKI